MLFAGVIFVAADIVMCTVWAADNFFDDQRGLLPYAIATFITLLVGRISWLISTKLVR